MKYLFKFNKSTEKGQILYPEIKRVVKYAVKLNSKTITSPMIKVSRTENGFEVITRKDNKVVALVSFN